MLLLLLPHFSLKERRGYAYTNVNACVALICRNQQIVRQAR